MCSVVTATVVERIGGWRDDERKTDRSDTTLFASCETELIF
ncbi:hypothetical protein [Natrinema gelatinilyticum]|nr:hypothetical protein [Natrinema gelatinilyticum]